jgi:hypothetical protein
MVARFARLGLPTVMGQERQYRRTLNERDG